MTHISQNLGKSGEEEAVNYLKNEGFEILATNWRFKHLEVDIIAMHKDELVVIEVKSRSTDAFGEPEVFVSKQKQRNLIKAANAYINEVNFNGETRFDVISILQINQKLVVKHIQNAFYPSIN
jgi:putative endonuclease